MTAPSCRLPAVSLAAPILGCVSLALLSQPAAATLVIFEHGAGIKSMGAGGTAYAAAEEATAIPGNPAHAAVLGNRYDVGIDVLSPLANARFDGNLFGPDERPAARPPRPSHRCPASNK